MTDHELHEEQRTQKCMVSDIVYYENKDYFLASTNFAYIGKKGVK